MYRDCKRYLVLLMAVLFVMMSSLACEAKGLNLQVGFVDDIVSEDSENHLLTPQAKQEIRQALKERLRALQSAGKLPFELKSSDVQLNNLQQTYDTGIPVVLIPIVTMDDYFPVKYYADGKIFYKATVLSGLSLAVCTSSDNMDCRLLAVVPLNRYGIMGGDIRRPIMQPISKADASQEYIALTKQGIAENMDFRSVKRVLKDWQLNQAIPACGVTEVTMTSKKAKAIFQDDPHHIRNAIADFYTMAYQQASGEPVILPMTSVKFVEDVHRSMYEGVLRGDSGTLNLAMAKPAHPIVLDVSGAASKVLQRSDPSDVREDIAYKVWLSAKTGSDAPVQDSDYATEMRIKNPDGSLQNNYDEVDTCSKLLINLAGKMGKQAGKQKH